MRVKRNGHQIFMLNITNCQAVSNLNNINSHEEFKDFNDE